MFKRNRTLLQPSATFLIESKIGKELADNSISYTEFKTRTLLPAGLAYLAHARRIIGQKTFSQDDEDEAAKLANSNSNSGNDKDEDDLGIDDEPEAPDLMFLDPKDWKVRSSALSHFLHFLNRNRPPL